MSASLASRLFELEQFSFPIIVICLFIFETGFLCTALVTLQLVP